MKMSNTVKDTYNNKLCCSCGMCIGLCPQKAISYEFDSLGYFKPIINENKCINCGLCYKLCPGANFLIQEDATIPQKWEIYYDGFSNDKNLRYESASGGLTTELLIFLIQQKIVDECIIVGSVSSVRDVNPIFTNNPKVIQQAKGSKYCPIPMGNIIDKISENKKYAIVAVPCQIQVLAKMFNKRRDDFIFISLFCNHCSSVNATEYISSALNVNANVISYRGKGWPGYITYKCKDKEVRLPFRSVYLKSFGKYFFNERCRYCNDPFGILADISVADAFHKEIKENGEGRTLCIVRSENVKQCLETMKNKQLITLDCAGNYENIFKYFPNQMNRSKYAAAYIDACKKYSKMKKLPNGVEEFVINMETGGPKLTIISYWKICIKNWLCNIVGKTRISWKIIFNLKRHNKEIIVEEKSFTNRRF